MASLGSRVNEARYRLSDLSRRLAQRQRVFAAANAVHVYPPVPAPVGRYPLMDEVIPEASGVYIAWEGPRVAYVGHSTCLRRRLGGNHEKVLPGDQVGWILLPVDLLKYGEAYYIGILFPYRNFQWSPDHATPRSYGRRSHAQES